MGRLRPWRAQSGGILEGGGGGVYCILTQTNTRLFAIVSKPVLLGRRSTIRIDILELSRAFNNILEDSRQF